MKSTCVLLFLACIVMLVIAGIAVSLKAQAASSTPAVHSMAVCSTVAIGHARCEAYVLTNAQRKPLVSSLASGPVIGSYGPSQFHVGYNLPCSVGGASEQAICSTPSSFGKQIIGIVDAYNDPTIQSDLNTYDTYYGLPACTSANGCFTVVNETGGTTLPATDSGWALEISLDVETAHEICQTCKILLVEATSNSYFDLATSVNTAVSLHATEVSNSYGGMEYSSEAIYDSYYHHTGVAITASSGDSGYGVEYPAVSPYVVAVSGTSLKLNSNNTYLKESVWSGSGSGCSAYESANAWQVSLANWSQTKCSAKRGVADVSADADPNTGAAIYDSTRMPGVPLGLTWFEVGGTSLSSPLIAAVFALAGGVSSNSNAQQVPYVNFTNSNSHDIINGNNGSCGGTIMCKAGSGYDGPSGLGTPNGTSGF